MFIILSDKDNWAFSQVIKLADFHNVSVDYLLNRTNNPKTAR